MNVWLTIAVALGVTAFSILYFLIRRRYNFWRKRGVRGPRPSLLTFGNVFTISGNPPPEIEIKLINKYSKLYGNFQGLIPTLTVADHELIKQLLVKDFASWVNRRQLNTYHEVMNHNQFTAEGRTWKKMRMLTGRAFTSGKLRWMHSMMERCIDRMMVDLATIVARQSGLLRVKEVATSFTIDVIALTSFATETKVDQDGSSSSSLGSASASASENPFVGNALGVMKVNPLALVCFFAMPRWFNDLVGVRIHLAPKPLFFFQKLAKEMIQQRKASGARRLDLLQFLMDTTVDESKVEDFDYDHLTINNETDVPQTASSAPENQTKFNETEMIAQSVLFLVAGFETSSSTITSVIYELTMNPAVQERLRGEIIEALSGLEVNSDAYYDAVMARLPYLDATLKETLRMFPPVVRLERRLTAESYNLAGIELQKGQLVEIPVPAVHYNPEYYPEPHQFKPERFLAENKHLLVPYTYLPFGDGPRNCVGMRFAYQEIKLLFARVLTQYRFVPISGPNGTPDSPQFEVFKPVLSVKPFAVKVEQL